MLLVEDTDDTEESEEEQPAPRFGGIAGLDKRHSGSDEASREQSESYTTTNVFHEMRLLRRYEPGPFFGANDTGAKFKTLTNHRANLDDFHSPRMTTFFIKVKTSVVGLK
jgi:hypothetical protein